MPSAPPSSSSSPRTPTSGAGVVAAGGASASGGAATLSRDLADFLVELSIAMHKHAIYPPGHPLLASAVDGVLRRIAPLVAERATLSIGVARRQLVIEGVATDPNHPLLQELAQKLHRNHLGAVKLMAGLARDELADALATLAADSSRTDRPLGMDLDALATRWEHVRLFPLTYERLELLEDDGSESEGGMRGGRAAQLWVGLARAALVSDLSPDDETVLEPVAVARAIEEHQREQAYDQVIVGYLLQIANELKGTEGAEVAALQRRVSRLVGALDQRTLGRLLEMGGDANQRRRFVAEAARGMTPEAVVDLVQAAASTEQQTISHSLVRLFTKLAKHAENAPPQRRAEADESLREAVTRLIAQWSLDDPNPDAYRMALETMSRSAPAMESAGLSMRCEPERIVQMGLEIGALGPTLWRAVDQLCDERRLVALLDVVDAAPDAALADAVWSHLGDRRIVGEMLAAERPDMEAIRRVVRRFRLAALVPALDALEAIDDARVREPIHDVLADLAAEDPSGDVGAELAGLIVRRLATARMPQLRELLTLLARLDATPEELDARSWLHHSEPAVRREALRLALRLPSQRDEAIVAAVADSDARTVYLALQAAQERCPRAAVALARARVERGELDPALRAMAIRVAATVHTPETLQWLIARAATRTKLLRRYRLLPTSPEMLAALASIAAGWATDPLGAPLVTLAAKSADANVRGAVH